MLYRCDSNNSECREGAAPERGEQAEHRQKETLKEGNGLCSSPCSSAAPALAGFGYRGVPALQTAGYLLILLRLCRVCTMEAVLDPAGHLSPIPPGLFPPLLALILPGEALALQQDCQQSHRHCNSSGA